MHLKIDSMIVEEYINAIKWCFTYISARRSALQQNYLLMIRFKKTLFFII